MRTKNLSRLAAVLLLSQTLQAQNSSIFKRDKPFFEMKVRKTGPYIGLQRGQHWVFEAGVEHLWKKVELREALSHNLNAGFNYNFRHNILGYDMGYWIKPHRIGLTYGVNVFFRTNFDESRVGIAPVLGFKFWILHLQTGYHFMKKLPARNFETNTFFVSLRVGLANERKVDWKLGDKKGKFRW